MTDKPCAEAKEVLGSFYLLAPGQSQLLKALVFDFDLGGYQREGQSRVPSGSRGARDAMGFGPRKSRAPTGTTSGGHDTPITHELGEHHSLTESIDTTTSGGKLVFRTFGAMAEFEWELIRGAPRPGWRRRGTGAATAGGRW
ncbi:MAG: hypothetical protein ACYCZN_07215 [Candidatus Dormibacteria bacterium]